MTEIYTTRKDWMLKLGQLKEPLDYINIHPIDDLTAQMVVEAMAAQGMNAAIGRRPYEQITHSYNVYQHGNCVTIQLREIDRVITCSYPKCRGYIERFGVDTCWYLARTCPLKVKK